MATKCVLAWPEARTALISRIGGETKNADLHRMHGESYNDDPQPFLAYAQQPSGLRDASMNGTTPYGFREKATI